MKRSLTSGNYDGLRWRRKNDPRSSLFEESGAGTFVARTRESIIDTWLYGEYLHFDEPRAAELVEGHPATEMMKSRSSRRSTTSAPSGATSATLHSQRRASRH